MSAKLNEVQARQERAVLLPVPLQQQGRLRRDDFNAMLEDAGALHRFLLDCSPELVYLLDDEGRIRFANRRFETLLGYRPNELIGLHYEVLVEDSFRNLASHVFNERRSGGRVDRYVALRLKSRPNRNGRSLAQLGGCWVEIRAEGIYTDPNERTPENYLGALGLARAIRDPGGSRRKLHFHAFHDVLTKLPNRILLNDRLTLAIAQAKRAKRKLAVMFLDLNRFKRVNDGFGHSVGDRLLQAATKRIQSRLDPDHTLSRFGGDEFILLLPDVRHLATVKRVAEKILERFETPFVIDGRQIRVGASVGIALYPEAGEHGEVLVENADIAMYHAKGLGRNAFEVYSNNMNRGVAGRMVTARELRRAVKRRDFVVHYRPQVCLASGSVRGFEAVARWCHPLRGMLKPKDFLPLAEDVGVISDIDAMVQQQAFTEAACWHYAGAAKVQVSVNVSAVQLEEQDFVDGFQARIAKAGLQPQAVRLEIDEDRLMQSQESALPKLAALRRMGVSVVVDGFGAGFASLGYLQHFSIDCLSVAPSIIHGIRADGDGTSIVKGIAAMASVLKMGLSAQGVVNRTQLRRLCAEGYQEAQGVLFSPPLPPSGISRLLKRGAFADLVGQARLPSAWSGA